MLDSRQYPKRLKLSPTDKEETKTKAPAHSLIDEPLWNAATNVISVGMEALENKLPTGLGKLEGGIAKSMARRPAHLFNLVGNYDEADKKNDPHPLQTAVVKTTLGNFIPGSAVVHAGIDGAAVAGELVQHGAARMRAAHVPYSEESLLGQIMNRDFDDYCGNADMVGKLLPLAQKGRDTALDYATGKVNTLIDRKETPPPTMQPSVLLSNSRKRKHDETPSPSLSLNSNTPTMAGSRAPAPMSSLALSYSRPPAASAPSPEKKVDLALGLTAAGLGGVATLKLGTLTATASAGSAGLAMGASLPLAGLSAAAGAAGLGTVAILHVLHINHKYKNKKIRDLTPQEKEANIASQQQCRYTLSDSQKAQVGPLVNQHFRLMTDAGNRELHVKRNKERFGGFFSTSSTISHGKSDKADRLRQAEECNQKILQIINNPSRP